MLRISQDALRYRCESSGRCCQGWPVEADRETVQALPKRLAGIPDYAGRKVLEEEIHDHPVYHRTLAVEQDHCVFLTPRLGCDLHARWGPEAKPLLCRQYPYLSVTTPLGTDIHLTYSCPSAAKRLQDPVPFLVIQDPADPLQVAYTVQAGGNPHVAQGSPLTWEESRAAGDAVLELLADQEREPTRSLIRSRICLEALRTPGMLEGAGRVREAFSIPQAVLETPTSPEAERMTLELLTGVFKRCGSGKPWKADASRLAALEAFVLGGLKAPARAWTSAPPEAWQAYRRYLCGKWFGSLLPSQYGLIPAFQVVLLLGLLVRLEAARRASAQGRTVEAQDLSDAAEGVDRLFPQASGFFGFWAPDGKALKSTASPVSAALILAAMP